MLTMLKIDLGISGDLYDERLTQYLAVAQEEMIREGYTFADTLTADEMGTVVMYAAWLWRRRDDMSGMPRMLRYKLNNMIFAQKMAEEES